MGKLWRDKEEGDVDIDVDQPVSICYSFSLDMARNGWGISEVEPMPELMEESTLILTQGPYEDALEQRRKKFRAEIKKIEAEAQAEIDQIRAKAAAQIEELEELEARIIAHQEATATLALAVESKLNPTQKVVNSIGVQLKQAIEHRNAAAQG